MGTALEGGEYGELDVGDGEGRGEAPNVLYIRR